MTEKQLIDQLNVAREGLLGLLTDEERKTKRRYGSDYPITFEDTARERPEMQPALDAFTASLNALFEYVFNEAYHEKLARAWAKKRFLNMDEGCTTIDDAASEALFQIRHALSRACPNNYRLFSYCWPIVFRSLDTWWGRQQAPVEMSLHVAQSRKDRPTRVSIDIVTRRDGSAPLKEEEDE